MTKLLLAAGAALVLAGPAFAQSAYSSAAEDAAPAADAKALSTRGVDFNDDAQVRRFYLRLHSAAVQVCNPAGPIHLQSHQDLACIRRAMADGVRAVNAPRLTALLDQSEGRVDTTPGSAYAIDAR